MSLHIKMPANSEPTPHAIEGIWIPVRLEYAGEAAPDMVLEKTEITFRKGAYAVRFGGEESFGGMYTLTEKTIHIEGCRASEKHTLVIRGIYQLVGDRLRICLGMDGVCPDAFATKSGSQNYLGTYRRQASPNAE